MWWFCIYFFISTQTRRQFMLYCCLNIILFILSVATFVQRIKNRILNSILNCLLMFPIQIWDTLWYASTSHTWLCNMFVVVSLFIRLMDWTHYTQWRQLLTASPKQVREGVGTRAMALRMPSVWQWTSQALCWWASASTEEGASMSMN